MDDRCGAKGGHVITIRDCASGSLTGVKDVLSFDEEEIILETAYGVLTLKGQGLHVKRLDLGRMELDVEGTIRSLGYGKKRFKINLK